MWHRTEIRAMSWQVSFIFSWYLVKAFSITCRRPPREIAGQALLLPRLSHVVPSSFTSLLHILGTPPFPPLPSPTRTRSHISTSAHYLPIQLLPVVLGSLMHLLDAWIVPRNQGHAAVPDCLLLCCLQGKENHVGQSLQPGGEIMVKRNDPGVSGGCPLLLWVQGRRESAGESPWQPRAPPFARAIPA